MAYPTCAHRLKDLPSNPPVLEDLFSSPPGLMGCRTCPHTHLCLLLCCGLVMRALQLLQTLLRHLRAAGVGFGGLGLGVLVVGGLGVWGFHLWE
jgi:hypothetical protein